MKMPMYTPEELAKVRKVARKYAEEMCGPDDLLMETLVGACYITEHKGVQLAVIVVHQDENGPLFRGNFGPGTS